MAEEILNKYVDQYWVDTPEGEKTIVTVTMAGGKLFAEVEGQGFLRAMDGVIGWIFLPR